MPSRPFTDDDYDRLLTKLYAGVTNEADLAAFLGDFATAAGCDAGEIGTTTRPGAPRGVHVSHGITQGVLDQYAEHYANVDELFQLLQTCEPPFMKLESAERAVDMNAFRETEICADWYSQLGASGCWHTLLATFSPVDVDMSYLGLYRPTRLGGFDGTDLEQLQVFVPHVARALKLVDAVRVAEAEVAAGRAALDRLPVGVVFCRRDGSVDWSNQVARAFSGGPLPFSISARGITLARPGESRRLLRAIAAAVNGASDRVEAFSVGGPLPPMLQLAVCPPHRATFLPDADRRAVVFVTDGRPRQLSAVLLQALYGLTPAESRVVAALCTGLAPVEIAQRLAVSKETVRSQLKAAFAKTGTSRQPELVAHVLGGLGWLTADLSPTAD